MRGRVGRSNKKAFCYLITPPYHMMTDDARKRIQALEIHSELGSGFYIAMKDLEIRGAGDLLGGEQSGFINDIGFEVKAIKGLARPSATAIAETTIPMVMDAIREIDGDDVDAIIQCGTNLSTVDIFPTMEHWLQKPLIPINIACVWHALRASGINDKIIGKGRLLEEF